MEGNRQFTERFKTVCGTSRPAEIQRLLNITYQAARNYLSGRLPDTKVLLAIASRTPYSIHWLLTGEGPIYANSTHNNDTPVLTDQMRDLIRAECETNVRSILAGEGNGTRVVVLEPEMIRSESLIRDAEETKPVR